MTDKNISWQERELLRQKAGPTCHIVGRRQRQTSSHSVEVIETAVPTCKVQQTKRS
jgi:hypothetical protein